MRSTTTAGRHRLLLLAPFPPRLDAHHGGSRAIAQLIAALAERQRLAVLYLRGPDDAAIDEVLRSRCELVEEVRHAHPRGLRRRVRQARVVLELLRGTPMWVTWWAVPEFGVRARDLAAEWRPDVVQLEFHLMAQYLPALAASPAARVLVEHDPGIRSALPFQGMADPRRLLAPLERRAWRRYEAGVMQRVDAVVAFTERDRRVLTALSRNTPVVRIPLGAALPEHPLSAGGQEAATLLFIGSYGHAPNADAADRLLRTIFPRLRAVCPEVRLVLVGTGLPTPLRRLAGAGVEIAGAVPDVAPFLDRASIVVLPVRRGGGMRVKALEALAAGKAVLASPLAMEGLDVVDGRECVLATTDAEFVERAAHLLARADERRRLGLAARAWALDHLSWSHVAAEYERLYQRVLEARCRRS